MTADEGPIHALKLERATRTAARLRPRLCSRAAEHDEHGSFPKADFDDLRHEGLFGLMVPTHLGGSGAGFTEYVDVAMELAAGNGATALLYNMHSSIIGALAHTSDDLAQLLGAPDSYFAARDRVLRRAADGAFFAVAMSERGAGARLSAMRTMYERVAGGFRVTGKKAFVSGAGFADAYLVAARSSENTDEVSYFLIPPGNGVEVAETWDSLGMRATGSHDVHFDTVVGEDTLVGGVEGLAVSLAQTMPQWLVASYAAVYVGVARASFDAAVTHVAERNLSGLPAVRAALGAADADIAGAQLIVREAARRIDSAPGGRETNQWVYRAKLTAGEVAMRVAASMLEIAGTSATRRGHPLERLFRDARCGALQPATSSTSREWLGATALGLNPSNHTEAPK